jgi:hypothetical protein
MFDKICLTLLVLFTSTYAFNHSFIDLSSPEKYILNIENSLNEGRYEDATRSYFRFYLRGYQDIKCSEDISAGSFLPTIKILVIQPMFERHQNQLHSFLSRSLILDVAKEIKYETETETDNLEDPTWVSKYRMFFEGNTMKPNYQWKEIRLQVIDGAIRELELDQIRIGCSI